MSSKAGQPGITATQKDLVNPGDVVGPASSTDNAAARFDGVTGKLLQNSDLIIQDTGSLLVDVAYASALYARLRNTNVAAQTVSAFLQNIVREYEIRCSPTGDLELWDVTGARLPLSFLAATNNWITGAASLGLGSTPGAGVKLIVTGDGSLNGFVRFENARASNSALPIIANTAAAAIGNIAGINLRVFDDSPAETAALQIEASLSTIAAATKVSRLALRGWNAGTFEEIAGIMGARVNLERGLLIRGRGNVGAAGGNPPGNYFLLWSDTTPSTPPERLLGTNAAGTTYEFPMVILAGSATGDILYKSGDTWLRLAVPAGTDKYLTWSGGVPSSATILRDLSETGPTLTGDTYNGNPVYRVNVVGAALANGLVIVAGGATELVKTYGHVENTGINREIQVNFDDGTNRAYVYRLTTTGAIQVAAAGALLGNPYDITVEYT